ncbi:unnamed protein product [Prorocentrum cordatum]|uniref:Uncharacterized protein n=1 Tax=Prorocentrum cordatum TaxID=2364126 RepID=A0ABN9WBB9_9DINO|nr:unnamed protein product [Polarella glacialis]
MRKKGGSLEVLWAGRAGVGGERGGEARRHAQKVPAKKWDLPQTRAQELGWFISQPVRADALRARRLAKRYDPMLTASAGPSGGLVLTASSSAPCLSASQPGGPRLSPLMPDCGPAPEMSVLNTPQWRKPRGQCAITKYADIYVKQMRCSPFNQSLAGR